MLVVLIPISQCKYYFTERINSVFVQPMVRRSSSKEGLYKIEWKEKRVADLKCNEQNCRCISILLHLCLMITTDLFWANHSLADQSPLA